jgi:hypothetical protein
MAKKKMIYGVAQSGVIIRQWGLAQNAANSQLVKSGSQNSLMQNSPSDRNRLKNLRMQ